MKRTLGTPALVAALSACLAACSFGLYSDDGSPSPGQWWPWVCPDAGDALAPEAGCEPPHRCPDGGADGDRDGC
jgi:hypothetical protein